jgi:uncharacterized OsmC-like protein
MFTSKVIYQGGLRTEARHERSGATLFTDAPPDNHGKGEGFSPTDLAATSLATCMLTVMGIEAEQHQIALDGSEVSIQKFMGIAPRRIVKIEAVLQVRTNRKIDVEMKKRLEDIAINCPVAKSLDPAIVQDIRFEYLEDNADQVI